MKSTILLAIAMLSMIASFGQEDKAKRPSPPAMVKETLNNGTVLSIDYSQPSVKGRNIGTDLEPMPGKVWRTGANEATVIEFSKNVKVNGKPLPAGKYGLFTIDNGTQWTVIFNKTWKQWGAFDYKEADDALRIDAKATKSATFAEKMTFTISKKGDVTLLWGDKKVDFMVN